MCPPPRVKLKQQVHYLAFHPSISAWIVVRLQRVKSMGISFSWKKCSQLVEQMDFSVFFCLFRGKPSRWVLTLTVEIRL